MLAASLFLLFHGAGVPAIDAWRQRRSLPRSQS
jgi:hypothetical protein